MQYGVLENRGLLKLIRKGIVAYKAKEFDGMVIIDRTIVGNTEQLITTNWNELSNFLTEDKGEALHIVWDLAKFTNCIFSLLPGAKQKESVKRVKIYCDNVKIFNTRHLLGLTKLKQLQGNIYDKVENNFYGINHWLSCKETPVTTKKLELLGYQLLEGLEELKIYPSKLTSPVGLFCESVDRKLYPTIYNFNEDYLEAMDWANQVANYEWTKVYKNYKKELHQYDLTSAYPSLMLDLPDTRIAKAEHSDKWLQWDWGIVNATLETDTKVLPVNKKAKYFTTDEILWVFRRGLGHFDIKDGWYFKFGSNKPYRNLVSKLLEFRNNSNSEIVSTLSKRIANGLSGKLDQYNDDSSFGELFNPILALMVRNRNRLNVGSFIYDNKMQDDAAKVLVDSVYSVRNLELPEKSLPGEWRKVK